MHKAISAAALWHLKRALDRRLDREKGAPTPTVRRTLKQAIALARRLADEMRAFGDSLPAARLESAIASGLVGQINFIIDWALMGTRIEGELKPAMISSYTAGARDLDKKLRSDGVAIRFDVMNVRAEQWASRYAGNLITEITEDQRFGVSRLIEAAHKDGRTPQETARDIRNIVGLHSRQVTALERYRADLIASETPPEKVSRLTEKYSRALMQQRSMVISRTELLRSTHEGQVQFAREGIQQGLINKNRTFRQWVVTDDDRLDTELCLPMSEPDLGEVQIDQPWILPDGREAWTPQDSHPNCRCTFSMIVKHPEDEEDEKGIKYSDDQPRDDQGRFAPTSGGDESGGGDGGDGGGSEADHAASTYAAMSSDEKEHALDNADEAWFDFESASAIKAASRGEDLRSFTTSGGESLTPKERAEAYLHAVALQDAAQSGRVGAKIVYRGETAASEAAVKDRYKLRSEHEFDSLSAVSTDRGIATIYSDTQYSGGEGVRVMLHIENPKGVVGYARHGEGAGAEAIIPRGAAYRVTGVKKDGDTFVVSLYKGKGK